MFKVLIVDDEKPVREAIRALGNWERLGVDEIYEAVEGESALEIMRRINTDIVFVDMKMPRMNGVEFLHAAVPEFPNARYIVVSGYDDFEYTREAIKAHAMDYLLKPVIEAELEEALERAVRSLEERKEPVPAVPAEAFPGFRLESEGGSRAYLYEIRDYIEHNYTGDIRLNVFSERYFLSKEYLSRQFREEFGYNIYEYVLKVRMDKAKRLLAEPGVRIQAVAEYLGYKDSNYFSRAFKSCFGISPSEYRETCPF